MTSDFTMLRVLLRPFLHKKDGKGELLLPGLSLMLRHVMDGGNSSAGRSGKLVRRRIFGLCKEAISRLRILRTGLSALLVWLVLQVYRLLAPPITLLARLVLQAYCLPAPPITRDFWGPGETLISNLLVSVR